MTHAQPKFRRSFLLAVATAALLAASPAHADFVDDVREQLQQQGYQQISVSSTLLGRSKIVAYGKKGMREIIMNPRTGEILRDQWTSAEGAILPSIVGDDDEDDDSDDDDGDDDSGDDDSGDDDGGDDNSGSDSDDGGDDNSGSDGDSGGEDGGEDD
ncbi:hypothetical protein [Tabrizicola oligotrophica]|uniref:hypothetical protein n=1 Tax=Tabrizicola oligotrophica TaxID=2710650 RepID=UPI001D12B469|nr:hypothetical protein [Tabrizicola oligotrophica]